MSKKLILLLFILFTASAFPQEYSTAQLDSLYNLYVAAHPSGPREIKPGVQSAQPHIYKCLFGLTSEIRFNLKHFSPAQRKVLEKLLSRPSTDTSFVTPNGYFRIHYDLTGPYVPKYNVDSLGVIFDSVYNFEVNYLGYPPPPSDNGAGGDDRYDIYITGLNGYGETDPDVFLGNKATSFILFSYDFSGPGFYTHGLDAARVTAAHEFHHAIQMGDYIYRYDLDGFFYEMTSTSMEHFVYPSIHDYYGYLPSYFNNTQRSIGLTDAGSPGPAEYALAIWNIFLQEQFGYGIIKREWELMPEMRALNAINQSLIEDGQSFGDELNKFGVWMYFTNYRVIPGKYFKNAADYPVVKPVTTLNFHSPSTVVQMTTEPVSNSFITFVNPSNLDTLTAIISNWDLQRGIDSIFISRPFTYGLYGQNQTGVKKITGSYYAYFNSGQPAFWLMSHVLNNALVSKGEYTSSVSASAFPSPFEYGKNPYLYIPAQPDPFGKALLNVYTAGMRLVFSSEEDVEYIYGQKVIKWNGRDEENKELASGVYIYVTKSGDAVEKGKIAIFQK